MTKALQLTSFEVEQLFHAIGQLMHGSAGDLMALGLTPPQLATLANLSFHDECTMSELARELGLTLPTATGIVDRLIRGALVDRRHDEDDRRVVRVSLTGVGRRRLADAMVHRGRKLAEMLDSLQPDDRAELIDALKRVCRVLGQTDGEGAARPVGLAGRRHGKC